MPTCMPRGFLDGIGVLFYRYVFLTSPDKNNTAYLYRPARYFLHS